MTNTEDWRKLLLEALRPRLDAAQTESELVPLLDQLRRLQGRPEARELLNELDARLARLTARYRELTSQAEHAQTTQELDGVLRQLAAYPDKADEVNALDKRLRQELKRRLEIKALLYTLRLQIADAATENGLQQVFDRLGPMAELPEARELLLEADARKSQISARYHELMRQAEQAGTLEELDRALKLLAVFTDKTDEISALRTRVPVNPRHRMEVLQLRDRIYSDMLRAESPEELAPLMEKLEQIRDEPGIKELAEAAGYFQAALEADERRHPLKKLKKLFQRG